MQLLGSLVLVAVLTRSAAAVEAPAVATPQVDAPHTARTHLRGLLAKLVLPYESATPAPVRELTATWANGSHVGEAQVLCPISETIVGGQTVVVFHDRRRSAEATTESAVVAFDVRSSPNCVVSVCGELSKWYLGAKEQCFDLRIAPKSPDPRENGLIRGVSAAYSGRRPVASNLYLKFDATNFIDGSKCEYEILSGSKTVREEEVTSGAQTAVA